MNCPSIAKFVKQYQYSSEVMRMGQFFVHKYIEGVWPELFYEPNDTIAIRMITQYLIDNQYTNELPPISKFYNK